LVVKKGSRVQGFEDFIAIPTRKRGLPRSGTALYINPENSLPSPQQGEREKSLI